MIRIFLSKTIWVAFLLAFLCSFMIVAKVHAENVASGSAEQAAKKYGVTFPIAELGSCANLNECKTYCSDPVNQTQCTDFAKKKGFYKEQKNAVKNSIAIGAKLELGCDSESACKAFRGNQVNWQKCGEFAKKHNLGGGQVEDPAKREILGCDSVDSCKGFCQKEENQQKCDEFAKLVGLRGGVEKKGPGGCTSLDSCKAFCSDPQNFQLCQGFVKATGGQFKGPGGCDSEDSCKTYCQLHELECKNFAQDKRAPLSNIHEYCIKTPNCSWNNDRCECKSFMTSPPSPIPNTQEYYQFCKEHPDQCPVTKIYSPYPSASYDPAKKCAEYGCSWTGTGCSCTNKSPNPSATPVSSSTTCQPPASGCGAYNYFDKVSCSCKTYQDYCNAKPGCTWTNNSCQCATISSPVPTPSSTTVFTSPAPH